MGGGDEKRAGRGAIYTQEELSLENGLRWEGRKGNGVPRWSKRIERTKSSPEDF